MPIRFGIAAHPVGSGARICHRSSTRRCCGSDAPLAAGGPTRRDARTRTTCTTRLSSGRGRSRSIMPAVSHRGVPGRHLAARPDRVDGRGQPVGGRLNRPGGCPPKPARPSGSRPPHDLRRLRGRRRDRPGGPHVAERVAGSAGQSRLELLPQQNQCVIHARILTAGYDKPTTVKARSGRVALAGVGVNRGDRICRDPLATWRDGEVNARRPDIPMSG